MSAATRKPRASTANGTPRRRKRAAAVTPVSDVPDADRVASATLTVTLPERVGIADVAALQQSLRAAGACGPIDAGAVQSIDTAGLQLLVVHVRELQAGASEPRWQEVSTALRESARALDLLRHLNLPEPQ